MSTGGYFEVGRKLADRGFVVFTPFGEWVEYEYAKVRSYYERKGKGDLTEIDLPEGGHIINGVKSYPFL